MDGWKSYRRKEILEMRPYVPGETLRGVIVSNYVRPQTDGGMIARNPSNPNELWYMSKKYFEENFELVTT